MIEVTILDNGSVKYQCRGCSIYQVVEIHDTESPFWDMHNGLAVLAMLGHYITEHGK